MKKALKVLKTALKAYTVIVLIYDYIGYCGRLTRDFEDSAIEDGSVHGFATAIWDDVKYYINWWINYIKTF